MNLEYAALRFLGLNDSVLPDDFDQCVAFLEAHGYVKQVWRPELSQLDVHVIRPLGAISPSVEEALTKAIDFRIMHIDGHAS